MRNVFLAVLLTMCCVVPATAMEVSGVAVEDQVSGANGVALSLNGAGVRTKFFFDIYVAELYLQTKADNASAVISNEGAKRMVMHFLYKEVGPDDLVETWSDGFKNNGTADQLTALAEEIRTYNGFFATPIKKGEQVVLDYLPGTGTIVSIRGEQKGIIAGKPFNDLLLSVWLGNDPADEDLKAALLGK